MSLAIAHQVLRRSLLKRTLALTLALTLTLALARALSRCCGATSRSLSSWRTMPHSPCRPAARCARAACCTCWTAWSLTLTPTLSPSDLLNPSPNPNPNPNPSPYPNPNQVLDSLAHASVGFSVMYVGGGQVVSSE
eukprot:scaffold67481_cov57-Phaeocystis_antarctica.AAC.6